jgi:hypothetical protein
VFGPVKVLGGVLVLGRIAATHMTAVGAQTQMDPGITGLDAVFADIYVRGYDLQVVCQMSTFSCHFDRS